jgi:fructosamine-3-kinase
MGYHERRAIYMLWTALGHLRLFGRGYSASTKRLLATVGV